MNKPSHSTTRIGKLLIICVGYFFAANTASAAQISVNNPSFEDPLVTSIPGFSNSTQGPFCFSSVCPSIPGWEFSGIGGLFKPNASVFSPAVMDGIQVFDSDDRGNGNGFAVQFLNSVLYQQDVDYSLTVSVGTRADFSIGFGEGEITLFAGANPDNIVGTLDLSTITAPSPGQFTDVTLALTAADVQLAGVLGETIGIRLGGAILPQGSSAQTIFDSVRLTAVPIPASVWLFISALGILGIGLKKTSRGKYLALGA